MQFTVDIYQVTRVHIFDYGLSALWPFWRIGSIAFIIQINVQAQVPVTANYNMVVILVDQNREDSFFEKEAIVYF